MRSGDASVGPIDELGPSEWLVSQSSWVIQDGNYPDFAVGERHRFALAFDGDNLRQVPAGTRSAKPMGDGRYDVTADVAITAKDLLLLDFGLLAYSDRRRASAPAGTWLAGAITLAVDPYFYFESHARRKGIPPTVYTWTITGIWRRSARPGSPVQHRPGMSIGDPQLHEFSSVGSTNAAEDDGLAEYLLRCRHEPEAPTNHP